MNQKLGSKNGKNNRRLFFLNKKRKQNLQSQELVEKKEKEKIEKEKKIQEEINIKNKKKIINNEDKIIDLSENKSNYKIPYGKRRNKIVELANSTSPISNSKEQDTIPNQIKDDTNIKSNHDSKNTSISIKKEMIQQKKDISTSQKDSIEPQNIQKEKKVTPEKSSKSEENNLIEQHSKKAKQQEEIQKDSDYLEKQIIKILEQQIDENRYQLKKIDSEIYSIKKTVDSIHDDEDMEEIEKQMESLMKKINEIKKQIESLKKTFDLDFPIEEPDNYLIYLVEEYQDKRKVEKELSEKLKQNQEFKSLIDRIIEIEEQHQNLKNQMEDKKESLSIDNEQVAKLTQDMISIEDMKDKIDKMLNEQMKMLEEIKIKVDETVHITEKVDFITKSVKHSLLDLLLLMSVLKHNLSIKNSVIAAVSAKIALDMIMKMTTPIQEKVVMKENDLVNYEQLIVTCLNDTSKLENMMDDNLNSISSIHYTFEHDYKDCSYLDSYQEAMNQLISLEEEMKDRKNDVIKMRKETEAQLEKNNSKVNKYGSIVA